MNEEVIFSMVQPYIKNGTITYDEFDNIFSMLSRKEQYLITDILYRNKIELIDKSEESIGEKIDLNSDKKQNTECKVSESDFKILYDTSIFEDYGLENNEDTQLKQYMGIKQSNLILCTLIQQGNKQAEQDLCVKNRGLVDKYAKAYEKKYGSRLDFEDLEQVGFIGLLTAARRFEVEREVAFSTYAVWWISQAISREIMDHGYAIHIPVHMMERIAKVVRLDDEYGKHGYDFKERICHIVNELHLTEEQVRECLILRKNYLSYTSLDMPIGEEEEESLIEMVPSKEIASMEEIICQRDLQKKVRDVLKTLSEREQKVIKLRFGMEDGKVYTLEEVGRVFNVTRERIRQIHVKALRKLKKSSRLKKLKGYY